MHWHHSTLALAVTAFVALGCSDSPTAPDADSHPWLILSEPMKLAPADDFVTFASVRPAEMPGAVSVEIRNRTAGTEVLPVQLVNGGFDPVAVPGRAGDEIEFAFQETSGGRHFETATVPAVRPPTILRTSIRSGATGVPVDAQLSIVFTEPLDPATLVPAVALTNFAYVVDVTITTTDPWSVVLDPGTTLEPDGRYTIRVERDVRSRSGRAMWPGGAIGVSFSTESAAFFAVTEPGRIAFASDRDGGPSIYVVNSDASGLVRLAPGEAPAWSPDGSRIAFHTPQMGPCPDGPGQCPAREGASAIRVIDADGSNSSVLALEGARYPSWSADGQRIAFERGGQIYSMRPDGADQQLLIASDDLSAATGLYHRALNPSWSPDGLRIAFIGMDSSYQSPQAVLIANADGTGIRRLVTGETFHEQEPAWTTDGKRLAFLVTSYGGFGHGPYASQGRLASAGVDGSAVRAHAFGAGPDWSPGGAFLLYSRHTGQPQATDWGDVYYERIFIADVVTGRRRQLVPDALDARTQAYSDYDAAWFRPGS